MTSINSINSASIAATTAASNTRAKASIQTDNNPSPPVGNDQEGTGSLAADLMAALEALGVKTSELGESGEFEHDDDPGKASASNSTATDLKAFLQQLFTAIKQSSSSESTATSASATSIKSAATRSTALPSKLSNLISQVSSGKTPAELQAAFEKLTSGSAKESRTKESSTATLQAVLEALQARVGYGQGSSTAAVGNLVRTST